MAFHHVGWSDCSNHPHLSEARALLDRFWEDHKEQSARPTHPESEHAEIESRPPEVAFREGPRSARVARRGLGPVVVSVVVGSWVPVWLVVDLLDTSPLVKIGIVLVAVYLTLALGYFALRRLGVE